MDDMWGDDLPDDIIEECVLLASQATSTVAVSPKCDEKKTNAFKFKSPIAVLNQSHHHQEKKTFAKPSPHSLPSSSLTVSDESSSCSVQNVNPSDIELLKEENKVLAEENLIRSGETSILRADLQQLRKLLEKRDVEASKQLDLLKKQIKEADSQHLKQLEASKTEMKFKELELEEMRNKCRRIELKGKEPAPFSQMSQVHDSPQVKRFLSRSAFDSKPSIQLKASLTNATVQTESIKRFRLDPSNTEGLNSYSNTSIIIDSVKHCLLSEAASNDHEIPSLLEELKFRMIGLINEDYKEIVQLLHNSDSGLIELMCSFLERDKNTPQFTSYIEFLSSWIVNILPILKRDKCERLLNLILSEIRRFKYRDILVITTAIISHFGLDPICGRVSGCLLEKAALQLKDGFRSLENEDKLHSATLLVLALSTILSCSTALERKEKCPCIPHLLRTLVLIIQHVTENDVACLSASEMRLKLLIRVFRLSLAILKARCEPWLTFINSQSEVNRLFTILTAISEVAIPKAFSHHILVTSFTGPGLGLCG